MITTIAGDGIASAAGMDLEGPAHLRSITVSGLAVDPTGIVYFSDSSSGVIRRVSKTGQLEIFVGVNDPACLNCSDGDGGTAKAAHLNNPGLLTLDSSGNLYVASDLGSVRRISPDGLITKFAGYGAFPADDGLFHDGGPALGEYFGSIVGLSADGNGNVYVAHERQPLVPRVRRIDSNALSVP